MPNGQTDNAPLPALLFDLEVDISEKRNVLAANGEVAKRLQSYADEFKKVLAQNSRTAALIGKPVLLSQ